MPSVDQGRVRRAERWALMEWILVGGRRWWLLIGLLLMMAVSVAMLLLLADGVSHLNPTEQRQFFRYEEKFPQPRGPLLRHLPESE
jgi:hypothetical protein